MQLEPVLMQKIAQQVSEIFGLLMPKRMMQKLQSAILQRMEILDIKDFDKYAAMILSHTLAAKAEFEALSNLLVNIETYFFRDQGQFDLLRDQLLPEILMRHQMDRHIHIWCAGCSTGQEAYSLAIVLSELIQQPATWNISILATDINPHVLEIAETGVYPLSATRGIEEDTLKSFFVIDNHSLKLIPTVQRMVTFGPLNLVKDPFPTTKYHLHEVDLILCRNVFIYFQPDIVKNVVEKFTNTLCTGGVLMTGHGELMSVPHRLKMEVLPQSAIFRKK